MSAVRFDDLPADVVARAKLVVLDQLGVQLLGATLPHVLAWHTASASYRPPSPWPNARTPTAGS